MDADTADMRRPDHAGYVVDPFLDDAVANGQAVKLVQVWVDPKRPLAHRDPALRAYLARVAAVYGMMAVARTDSHHGTTLIPPSMSADGDWIELEQSVVPHAQLEARLAAVGGPLQTAYGANDHAAARAALAAGSIADMTRDGKPPA